jgi:hypothetical protein
MTERAVGRTRLALASHLMAGSHARADPALSPSDTPIAETEFPGPDRRRASRLNSRSQPSTRWPPPRWPNAVFLRM